MVGWRADPRGESSSLSVGVGVGALRGSIGMAAGGIQRSEGSKSGGDKRRGERERERGGGGLRGNEVEHLAELSCFFSARTTTLDEFFESQTQGS